MSRAARNELRHLLALERGAQALGDRAGRHLGGGLVRMADGHVVRSSAAAPNDELRSAILLTDVGLGWRVSAHKDYANVSLLTAENEEVDMNLLAQGLQTSIQVPAVQFNLGQVLLGLAALLPIVGGYLLAREGRGNLLLDVLAVILLVLATVIPFQPVSTLSLQTILTDFISRWPLMVFLLGIAFVRDGGWRIVLGVALMAVSGLILIPQV